MRRLLAALTALIAFSPGLAHAAPPSHDATPPNQNPPTTQIIGGQQASVADYPFVIAMLREGGTRPQGQTCTSAVVARRVIVTAAHCKNGDGAKTMLYGSDDLTKPGGTKLAVKEYLQHPNYQPPNGWQQGWDVGIVVTETDIPVPAGYKYPRVADSTDTTLDDPGKKALLLGYGRVRDGENEFGHLKKVENFPLVDGRDTCGSFGSFNDAYMICGGYADGHDGICQGDSGGPMLVDGVIVGVASWVKTGCGSYGAWGKLTGVMGDWANETIKKYSDPDAPTASFTANCANSLTCSFDGSASSPSIASYAWESGDSQTGTGATPSHTYATAGSYTVKLTVTDTAGKTGSTTKQVQAGAPPAGQPPRASFTVQCQWAVCSFNGTGSTDPDNDIASYAWNFGDGKTGTGATASNTYPNTQKTYTAELKVTDRAGLSKTTTKQIQCWSVGAQGFCFTQ
ncbi:PKD domain-containing protein [Kribbella sp. NPDC051587]|uniref:PKD domain-containing protein n=1 Tax=Kribbella sp. NPDC051587 TaxID=3364119 RepID=UPI00379E3B0B